MNKNLVFNLHIPTKLLFGCGELKKLATETMPGKKSVDCYLRRNFHEEVWLFR